MNQPNFIFHLRLLRYISHLSPGKYRGCRSETNTSYRVSRRTLFHTLQPFCAPPSTSRYSSRIESAQRYPQDQDIRSFMIQIVNENGSLDPPTRTADVLNALDRREFTLIQVGEGIDGRPPVCKIVTKLALREQKEAKLKSRTLRTTPTKQVEVNWAIGPRDLAHRLGQMANFIEKGKRVELILTRKQGKRRATEEEVENVMKTVSAAIDEVKAMQVSPMEGKPGGQVTFFLKKKT